MDGHLGRELLLSWLSCIEMDLRQLEHAVAVADELSFTRAAEECHVVRSALSHRIQRLEAELDMRLFERTSRRVRVTAAGELLVAYAQRILATVAEARVELDALAGLERGELSVGTTQTAGRVQISDMVRFASHGLATAVIPLAFARDTPAGAAPYAVLRIHEDVAMSVSAVRRTGPPGLALGAFLELLRTAATGHHPS
jgi:DNA-binding transcriptional LysR family regulator